MDSRLRAHLSRAVRSASRASACAGLLLLLCSSVASAQAWWQVSLQDHRDWWLSLSGAAARANLYGGFTLDTSKGDTRVDLDSDLGLDHDTTGWLEVDLQPFRGHHLRFEYMPTRFDATTYLSTTIIVDGEEYEIGDFVDSRLDIDQYSLAYRYDFALGSRILLSPLLDVSLVDVKGEISDRTLGLRASDRILLPVPYLGLRLELLPLSRLSLFALGKGMTIGKTATVWGAEAGGTLWLTRNLGVFGRYRVYDYNIRYSDARVDVRLDGPLAGATLRF